MHLYIYNRNFAAFFDTRGKFFQKIFRLPQHGDAFPGGTAGDPVVARFHTPEMTVCFCYPNLCPNATFGDCGIIRCMMASTPSFLS